MNVALLAGLGVGGGVLLIARGMLAPPPPLGRALAALDAAAASTRRGTGAAPRWGWATGQVSERLERDLRAAGTTPARHAAAKVSTAGALAVFTLAASVLAAAGGVGLAPAVVALGVVAAGAVGFVVPDLTLRSVAAERRRELRDALSAYLELAVTVMAGGGGIETALHDAAHRGSGWMFEELRQALDLSRLAGEAPWEGFRRLGVALGSDELVELAAGATLAGEHGARVRASLTARAASLRDHRLAEVEAEAQSATERMAVPVVLMLFAFVLFVGYPAVERVLVGL